MTDDAPSLLLAEFTIEPFEPSNPGPHVRAAIDVAEEASSRQLTVEVGPFGTSIDGPTDQVLAIVHEVSSAAIANGASRVSLQLTVR